jgi:hypothetical protein
MADQRTHECEVVHFGARQVDEVPALRIAGALGRRKDEACFVRFTHQPGVELLLYCVGTETVEVKHQRRRRTRVVGLRYMEAESPLDTVRHQAAGAVARGYSQPAAGRLGTLRGGCISNGFGGLSGVAGSVAGREHEDHSYQNDGEGPGLHRD